MVFAPGDLLLVHSDHLVTDDSTQDLVPSLFVEGSVRQITSSVVILSGAGRSALGYAAEVATFTTFLTEVCQLGSDAVVVSRGVYHYGNGSTGDADDFGVGAELSVAADLIEEVGSYCDYRVEIHNEYSCDNFLNILS